MDRVPYQTRSAMMGPWRMHCLVGPCGPSWRQLRSGLWPFLDQERCDFGCLVVYNDETQGSSISTSETRSQHTDPP